MNPHFLFPMSLHPHIIDEAFEDQAVALKQKGFETSVIDIDDGCITPKPKPDATCVYRGWMMNPEEYMHYTATVVLNKATPLTYIDQYLAAHHLPNWYPLLSRWTPNTEVFPVFEDNLRTASVPLEDFVRSHMLGLGWSKFQLKDYVKSLKTAGGSVITAPEEIIPTLENMEKYRGTIEGGVCVRQWESFIPGSETRYFVVNGRYFGQNAAFDTRAMRILEAIKDLIPSPFWSVDIAQRTDGEFRIVEIGDGQVSDLVGWTPGRFAEIWQ
jgi:hypothetical protein